MGDKPTVTVPPQVSKVSQNLTRRFFPLLFYFPPISVAVQIHTGVHSDQEQHEGVLPNFRLHGAWRRRYAAVFVVLIFPPDVYQDHTQTRNMLQF